MSEGCLFLPVISHLRLWNVYRVPRTSVVPDAPISPQMVFGQATHPTIIAGDFNLYHLSADPTRLLTDKEFRESDPFFSLASERGFKLRNTPRVYMWFPFTSNGRPSVLDLTFTSAGLYPFIYEWSTPFSSTGSDHIPTQVALTARSLSPPRPVPDWDRTNWAKAEDNLRRFTCPPLHPW